MIWHFFSFGLNSEAIFFAGVTLAVRDIYSEAIAISFNRSTNDCDSSIPNEDEKKTANFVNEAKRTKVFGHSDKERQVNRFENIYSAQAKKISINYFNRKFQRIKYI